MKKTYSISLLSIISLILIGFVPLQLCAEDEHDTLFQTSTINALLESVFEGDITFKELKEHGGFGLGTFNNLNGEMIALDGQFFQIKSDGKVYPVNDSQKTPFAVVTSFETDKSISPENVLDFDQLKQFIDSSISTNNIYYAIRIDGLFKYVKARSVPAQKKPYLKITEIVKTQPIFEFKDIKGTMIGFKLPEYMNGLNVPGYHFHFITEDKTAGGHVLGCQLKDVDIKIDYTDKLYLRLPDIEEFYSANLSKKDKVDINKVEK